MIDRILPLVGGIGIFHHDRELAPLDQQPVIRQNRDTLYSVAVVDLSGGDAVLTVPEVGDRYISVMVINQDHYINHVYHRPGTYTLTTSEFETDYVIVAARILFNPADTADLDAVHDLQDALTITTAGDRTFTHPDYDPASYTQVREALLTLGRAIGGLGGSFGRKAEVDPIHHLIATASAWGGLPDAEASYLNITPNLPQGRYTMTFTTVPADAFWSVSVYNADGYFEPDATGRTNINSVFAETDADGSTTIHLGDFPSDTPNQIPLPDGWNLLIRLYRPRLAELATWEAPAIRAA
ncbi:DUF1254 domain-containing protein [Microbacterium sp. K35]|uniref:DUF1254 domain-containing protein n=1 Tax=Microbacterium sp. K35 TaxID=2305440 RepID=UPI001F0F1733|nr:DUF1254 domain-containing protein [Microbacterium sp. K35]